jgi:alkanesulfonate monooxygenase SsuD/methylene tetrahydromethanopterin reductase-like flavin-dependent oxidoreductase (luciferase family)
VEHPAGADLRLPRHALPAGRFTGAAQARAGQHPGHRRWRGEEAHARLAARYANEFNVPFSSTADNARLFASVREACEEAGRDPSSLVYSSALVLCVGKDEAEIARRAAAIGREVDELREHGVAGTPAEAVDILGRYIEAGAERFYLQVLDLSDLDHLDLVASEVAPQLA